MSDIDYMVDYGLTGQRWIYNVDNDKLYTGDPANRIFHHCDIIRHYELGENYMKGWHPQGFVAGYIWADGKIAISDSFDFDAPITPEADRKAIQAVKKRFPYAR